MGFYQYQCKACEHIFDKQLSMSDRKLPESEPCPECSAMEVLQYMGGSPLIHSGEGLGSMKPNSDFALMLNNIKKKNTSVFNK